MESTPRTPCARCLDIFRPLFAHHVVNQQDEPELAWDTTLGQLLDSLEICPSCEEIWTVLRMAHARAIERFPDVSTDMTMPLRLSLRDLSTQGGISWAGLQMELDIQGKGFWFVRSATLGLSSRLDIVPKVWTHGPTSMQDRLQLLRSWFQDCELSHEECQVTHPYKPVRLIEITEDHPIRLVDRDLVIARGLEVQFATLSHRWGSSLCLKTTRENLASFTQEIPDDAIPPTFRDAIEICRYLNIRYLWIDSLCIVQDDDEEWHSEAYMMGAIYSSSTLTIAASDSVDSYGGCFPKTNGPVGDMDKRENGATDIERGRRFLHRGGGQGAFVIENWPQDATSAIVRISASHPAWPTARTRLDERGWVFQEQILSRRVVHCMDAEIHWHCKCAYRTEAGMDAGPNKYLVEVHDGTWHNWVTEYSRRRFTVPGDRLAATAGITNLYQQYTGHTPMLGMWEETVARDIKWIRCGPERAGDGELPANIPSWTWLSCHAPTKTPFPSSRDDSERWRSEGQLNLVEFNVKWSGLPITSSIVSTKLMLEGRMREMRLCAAPETRQGNPGYLLVDDDETDFTKGPIPWRCLGQFDDANLLDRPKTYYTCLFVESLSLSSINRDKKADKHYREIFLILEPVQVDGFDGYRRVGIASLSDNQKHFESSIRTTLRLF